MSWGSNVAPFESKVQSLNHELYVVMEKISEGFLQSLLAVHWDKLACCLGVPKICLFPNKSCPLQWAENKPLSGIATQSKSSCQRLSMNTATAHPLEHAVEGRQAERPSRSSAGLSAGDLGAKLPKQMSLLQAHLKPGPGDSAQQAPGRRARFCFLSGTWTPIRGHICKGC